LAAAGRIARHLVFITFGGPQGHEDSLVTCGRLSIGPLPRSRQTAAVTNRRAGYQPALHDANFRFYIELRNSRKRRWYDH